MGKHMRVSSRTCWRPAATACVHTQRSALFQGRRDMRVPLKDVMQKFPPAQRARVEARAPALLKDEWEAPSDWRGNDKAANADRIGRALDGDGTGSPLPRSDHRGALAG